MSKRLPVVLSLAALGLAWAALPSAAVLDPTAEGRVGCTAATPAVKTLQDAVKRVTAAADDPTKLRTVLGDVFNAVTGAQEAGCLPALPASAPAPPAPPAPPTRKAVDACLKPTVDLLGAALGGVGATLAVPPDRTATTAAVTRLASSVTAMNAAKCLPVELPVPGGLPTPALSPAPLP
ncbi:hypothetical protein ALI144C_25815 [Actinosynnema sp. ALI-1.44]|uniref:hypothetical protein n=1 Tax=Actinosynnema sp. ALI-1.44 TaxID=1933779 RepID=UPI00097C4BA4|nr:hypothetical protein [Actinosynnema sp. ALI-1.44]ONI79251.1 hypothetical protein ALI144C_25815 [Actinosynnema sp. ALI-1.44]